jgi:hypothetical protein
MSAQDALGISNGSGAQSAYAASAGGGGSKGHNSFWDAINGTDGNGQVGAGSGKSGELDIKRDPASLAAQSEAGTSTMGSKDPSDYFTLIHQDDNLFKIVERRYASKSKQWALSDAQQVLQSTQTMIRK